METPTSTRRITRSQTKADAAASSANRGNTVISDHDHPIKSLSSPSSMKCSRKDRFALLDISNDSPVLGLAMGSCLKKSGRRCRRGFREIRTPGSGEALLRGQVKILLKRVEKDKADQQQFLGHFMRGLLAPSPANTPQLSQGHGRSFKQSSSNMLLSVSPVHLRSIKKNLFL